MPDPTPLNPDHHPDGSAKETVISMVISLAMALIAKSYVVEAFVIPTGSMAPTLLGQHMLFRSPQSGYEWSVNPFYYLDPGSKQVPKPIQGDPGRNEPLPEVTDPVSTSHVNGWYGNQHTALHGYTPPAQREQARAGDRILVQKWLYELFPPHRFDVVVFKNPEEPGVNYIKRLIGLPSEQVWLADGDVFARPISIAKGPGPTLQSQAQPQGDWKIQRKPVRIQSSLWRLIYSSEYAPLNPVDPGTGRKWFDNSWNGEKWQTDGKLEYRCDTAEPTTLNWDTGKWPLWDWVPYNDIPREHEYKRKYPVSDLRVRAGIKPDSAGLSFTTTITARRHQFQAAMENGRVVLRMRHDLYVENGKQIEPGQWEELASVAAPALPPGEVTNVEFWHYDQSLRLFINDEPVASAEYDWSPSERILHLTGLSGDEYVNQNWESDDRLSDPKKYEDGQVGTQKASVPAVTWTFSGSALTLFHVGLDRDIYYQPAYDPYRNRPGLGTHPANLTTLNGDQFFCCGDNSPSSLDGRLWRSVDPWVGEEIDPTVGVVPRKLLLGKAFFVYFPAPHYFMDRIPIPDFGRMRFIR